MTGVGVSFHRSDEGYGWWVDLGKRVRWNSRRATTPMWPRIRTGADENCNRAITLMLYPLGHLDVWWEPKWRTAADGMCEICKVELCICGPQVTQCPVHGYNPGARAEVLARAPGSFWPSAARWAVTDALLRAEHSATRPLLATTALDALAPFYRDALEELADDETLRMRMASLLIGTANALKGDPGPLSSHDWSDLPRVAADLRAELAAAEQRGDQLLKGFEKAVEDPATKWVDANIVRMLIDRARGAAEPDTTDEGEPDMTENTNCAACGSPDADGPVGSDGKPWCSDCYAEDSAQETTP